MKKRILILTGIFPPDIGGPATQLDALSRELIKNGYQVKVLTFGEKEKEYPYLVKKVSNSWPFPLKRFFYLANGLSLGFKSDILYNQDLYTSGLTALILKKFLRKPLVTRFVGDSAWEKASSRGWTSDDIFTFQDKKYSWKIELYKKIRKKILSNSDRIIVVSHFLENLVGKIGVNTEKVKVIYNSIDFLEVDFDLKSKEELKNNFGFKSIVILTIARLTPWKGVDMLIEIMPELVKKYDKINLVVVGQGKELDKLKRLSQSLSLEKIVLFRGKLNRQDTMDHLKAADLFVLNTNYEGMSHCLLEAMKTKTPIITTKAGGNPETIKDKQTGLLVDYRDKNQWLEAINMVLDDNLLAEKLTSQAEDDLKRFSWSNLVDQTVSIFRSL